MIDKIATSARLLRTETSISDMDLNSSSDTDHVCEFQQAILSF